MNDGTNTIIKEIRVDKGKDAKINGLERTAEDLEVDKVVSFDRYEQLRKENDEFQNDLIKMEKENKELKNQLKEEQKEGHLG